MSKLTHVKDKLSLGSNEHHEELGKARNIVARQVMPSPQMKEDQKGFSSTTRNTPPIEGKIGNKHERESITIVAKQVMLSPGFDKDSN